MRVIGMLLLLSSLTTLVMWWAGPLRRWADRENEVDDEWVEKFNRDMRTHRGGHWRVP